jgi:hypothetical protein
MIERRLYSGTHEGSTSRVLRWATFWVLHHTSSPFQVALLSGAVAGVPNGRYQGNWGMATTDCLWPREDLAILTQAPSILSGEGHYPQA